jgi:cellulose synthase/poly-beta-1,6-N-acetylglucosamine synthase-like glycosyltransferase
LHIIQAVILTISSLFLGYLTLLSMLALLERRRTEPHSRSLRRLAVLVPAHNEEGSICRTIESALAVDYPRGRFELFVIADNCTDDTAAAARRAGATVLERHDDANRGKGQALRWAFNILLAKDEAFDSIIVVDADSTLSRNFLTVVNGYLSQGALVIQCNDMVRKNPGAWSSEMTRIGFILFNYVRPLGRRFLGFSAGLRGNGMAFASDVLRQNPWEAYSRAEDLEFGLFLLLRGIPVRFAPEATVTAVMPERAANAESQRVRWEGGRLPLIRRFAPRLLVNGITKVSLASLDALVDLVTPPLVTMLAFLIACGGLHALVWLAGWEQNAGNVIAWFLVAGLGIAHMIIGLVAYRADRATYMALLHIPRYALWKVLLLVKQLFRGRTREWIRTAREQEHKPVTETRQ